MGAFERGNAGQSGKPAAGAGNGGSSGPAGGRGPLRRLLSAALDIVYPEGLYCLCCGDIIEPSRRHGICDRCSSEIYWNISDPLERDLDMFSFDGVLPCCRYGYRPRQIISGFKNGGRPYAAKPIGSLMGERLFMSGLEADIIAAVPMHRDRLRARGFNQAELLAEQAQLEYERLGGKGLRYIPGLMQKPVATDSMRGSDAVKRRSLLHTSFSLSSQYADIIINKRIILADDVVTTGSTADACARVLKEAGAGRVYVLCFASGSGWSPQYERSDLI